PAMTRNSAAETAIGALVDSFYHRMLADPEVNEWFRGIDLNRLKEHQRAFLAVGLGGPEAYDGRSMRTAHTGLAITQDAYTTAVAHLTEALIQLGVDEPIVRQVIKRIETMRAAIVEVR
ncbi:MAG TPA: group 1 truncated hemoglobin, partial [Rhodoglobus sp.]|nr:group 1 truncated hemoglobin [Rhodoglobus sp.]